MGWSRRPVLTPENAPAVRSASARLPDRETARPTARSATERVTRRVYLTDAEFEDPHRQDRCNPPPADHHLDVTTLTIESQAAAVAVIWTCIGLTF
jgi:hypothetical protein